MGNAPGEADDSQWDVVTYNGETDSRAGIAAVKAELDAMKSELNKALGMPDIPKSGKPKKRKKPKGKKKISKHGRNLVLIDSGATCELAVFPAEWNGKPPKEAETTKVYLAVGSITGYKLDAVIYFHPDAIGGT